MIKKYKFQKASRLCKKKDFQFVYKTGRTFVDYAGIFYVIDSLEDGPAKIGIAAGKKLGNAVKRNRIKRLMREVYRNFQHYIKDGKKIIWIARKPLVDKDLSFFKKAFFRLSKKSGVFLEEENKK